MSIVTSQQLARYYDEYRTTEVTFNKQVVKATGLITKNVYLKILDRQVPCVIVASSLAAARVVAGVTAAIAEDIKTAASRVTLRWCFKLPDKVEPITFFVACHVSSLTRYAAPETDLQIVSLEFSQRPSDDLILMLGMLLEANANAWRRKDERIPVSQETMKKMGLESRGATLVVERTAHRCALRDVSFGGAQVLTAGSADTFAGRPVILKISRGDPGTDITLAGIVRRADELGGHKDIIAVGIEFQGDVPITYKLLISSYLSSVRRPPAAQPRPEPESAAADRTGAGAEQTGSDGAAAKGPSSSHG